MIKNQYDFSSNVILVVNINPVEMTLSILKAICLKKSSSVKPIE